jgi:hypothetical protein
VHDTVCTLSLAANSPETGNNIEERAEDWIGVALDVNGKQPPSCFFKRNPLTNQKPSKIAKAACLC